MDEQVDLWTEPRRRVAQEALLQSGVPAKAARSVASSELRGWSPSDITTLFNKVVDRRQPMHSFGVVFKVQQGRHAWVRAPDDLRRLSAESGLALCINTQGKWSLRKAGYIAISHVWYVYKPMFNTDVPAYLAVRLLDKSHTGDWTWYIQ